MADEKRLISLDEALKATHSEIYWTESQQAAVRSFLVQQPRVDAVEVTHGKWIDEYPYVRCSECNAEWINCRTDNEPKMFYYCPNCGAKMDGDGND